MSPHTLLELKGKPHFGAALAFYGATVGMGIAEFVTSPLSVNPVSGRFVLDADHHGHQGHDYTIHLSRNLSGKAIALNFEFTGEAPSDFAAFVETLGAIYSLNGYTLLPLIEWDHGKGRLYLRTIDI